MPCALLLCRSAVIKPDAAYFSEAVSVPEKKEASGLATVRIVKPR